MHSSKARIVAGTLSGLLVGLACAVSVLTTTQESRWMLAAGFVLWYATLGAMIAVLYELNRIIRLGFQAPWWLQSSLLGGWFNFVLVLLAYDQFGSLFASMARFWWQAYSSPFLLVLEGSIAGFLIVSVCKQLNAGPSNVTQSR